MDSLYVVMWCGHHVFYFILFLYADWPLHKNSLCGQWVMGNGQWAMAMAISMAISIPNAQYSIVNNLTSIHIIQYSLLNMQYSIVKIHYFS